MTEAIEHDGGGRGMGVGNGPPLCAGRLTLSSGFITPAQAKAAAAQVGGRN